MEELQQSEIITQSLAEIEFDRTYKQGKIKNWQKNEEMVYGVKQASTEARANIDLAQMQEFVHTLLSKIDDPLIFTFVKRKKAQLKRVQRLNALRDSDRKVNYWDIKDLVGKKQGIIYGRAIYVYYADSIDGTYKAHLENVDVYDFLIDPSAGGIDIEEARNLGRFGLIKSRQEIEEGIKDGRYLESAQDLVDGVGDSTEKSKEDMNKDVRSNAQETTEQKEISDKDKYKFWDWFTTYNGERYHVVLNNGGQALVVEPLTDIFASGLYPFWSWACFPDLTEFWTPSECDFVRELLMAQNVTINQMMDNNEAINKPQKVVVSSAIENLAELKYRRDGVIRVKQGNDINRVYQTVQVPSINTPLKVFEALESIKEKAMGVTAGSKGVADEKGKVGIYEGNQEAAADRFGLLNKSYSFGTDRFAKLYEMGVREHLNKKTSIDIMGSEGIETERVSKRDIFHKNDDFTVLTESSNAENAASIQKQRIKLNFLIAHTQDQTQNPKKAYEMGAKISGFDIEEIKQLQEVDYGNQELMSEAERDIEKILDGEEVIKPNRQANNAYKRRILEYLQDHIEDMKQEQIDAMIIYIDALNEVVYVNEARALNQFKIRQMEAGGEAPINNNPPQERENNEEQATI